LPVDLSDVAAPDGQTEAVEKLENADGEMLGSPALLDLMLDPEVAVQEVVDHYEHYNESEDQAYQIFSSIRVSCGRLAGRAAAAAG